MYLAMSHREFKIKPSQPNTSRNALKSSNKTSISSNLIREHDIKLTNKALVRRLGDIMHHSPSTIVQKSTYKEQINERMTQERKAQLAKIMQENYKMLQRIKKCRSQYALEGGPVMSSKKRNQIAEKLAEGLVRGKGGGGGLTVRESKNRTELR